MTGYAEELVARAKLLEATREELVARAMLLGMTGPFQTTVDGIHMTVFRKRVAKGEFHGTALFSYFDAYTFEPVEGLQGRSELDSD